MEHACTWACTAQLGLAACWRWLLLAACTRDPAPCPPACLPVFLSLPTPPHHHPLQTRPTWHGTRPRRLRSGRATRRCLVSDGASRPCAAAGPPACSVPLAAAAAAGASHCTAPLRLLLPCVPCRRRQAQQAAQQQQQGVKGGAQQGLWRRAAQQPPWRGPHRVGTRRSRRRRCRGPGRCCPALACVRRPAGRCCLCALHPAACGCQAGCCSACSAAASSSRAFCQASGGARQASSSARQAGSGCSTRQAGACSRFSRRGGASNRACSSARTRSSSSSSRSP